MARLPDPDPAILPTADPASLPRLGRPGVVLALSITILGLGLGAVGVYLLPAVVSAWWLLASLLVDCVDGSVARWRRATSDLGGWLDWSVDTALSYAIVYRLLPGRPEVSTACMCALVLLQAGSRAAGLRWSGRTAVTLIAVVVTGVASGGG